MLRTFYPSAVSEMRSIFLTVKLRFGTLHLRFSTLGFPMDRYYLWLVKAVIITLAVSTFAGCAVKWSKPF